MHLHRRLKRCATVAAFVGLVLVARVYATTDTIGNTSTGTLTDSAGNTMIANVFSAPSSGGTPATFHAMIKSNDGSTIHWKCGVYATSGGTPEGQSLLSDTVVLSTSSTSFTDVSASINWSSITSGTNYALTCDGEPTQERIEYDNSGTLYVCGSTEYGDTRADYSGGSALPSTFCGTSAGPFTEKLRVWVVYTQSGGAATPGQCALLGLGKC